MKLFIEKCHTHLIKWTQTTQKLLFFFIKCFEEKKIEKKFAHEKRKKNIKKCCEIAIFYELTLETQLI